jgi:hypothetical protein
MHPQCERKAGKRVKAYGFDFLINYFHQMHVRGLKKFTLTLCLRVPPSSGFLMYYRHSPIVVIDKYTGEEDDALAPEWLRAHRPERKFWQQRSLMLDLILYFVADLLENARLSSKVKTWCKAISVSNLYTIALIDGVTTYHQVEDSRIWYDDFCPSKSGFQARLSIQYAWTQAAGI